MDYGASGNGRADDSRAIVAALAAAAKFVPAIVSFPAGHTFLTRPFNITSSLTLEIHGTVKWATANNTGASRWGLDFLRGTACSPPGAGQSKWSCPVAGGVHSSDPAFECNGGYRCFANSSAHSPACQKYCHPAKNASVWPVIPELPSWGTPGVPAGSRWQSLIMAYNAHDVKIVGSGTIDGQGQWWWQTTNGTTNGTTTRELYPWLSLGRPRFVEFFNCTRVEMSGITVTNSPFWTLHFYNSSQVRSCLLL